MTNDHPHPNIVTVPIGLGGKTAPYVPDPAPTLLVELASVHTENEWDRLELERAQAEEEASAILASATSEATALVERARVEAEEIRAQAEGSAAARATEIEERQQALDDLSHDLDRRSDALADRERAVDDRFGSIDGEAAEAAAALAAARVAADEILEEARNAADRLLEHARADAAEEADSILTAARAGAESDSALEERIAHVESVHRIEVQVLHQREIELLETIARLEHRLELTNEVTIPAGEVQVDESPVRSVPDPRAIEIDLDRESADEGERVASGRHAADAPRRGAEVNGSSHLATYAPLTEQLSVGAFRASDDRRSRRKR